MSRCKRVNKKRVIAVLAILLAVIIWIIWGNVSIGITNYTVVTDAVENEFEGARIAQISDLHGSVIDPDIIARENVDIICITGDLLDSNKDNDIEKIQAMIAELAAVAPGQGIFPKYDAGIFQEKSVTMIVNRGIGNSIIPIRINNRPEVVIVTIERG